ncbi:MAG: adenosylmethionine decarboxylase [Victivallaceae bacterium]|nr:adenosylmethionine decarboxylase [Victivallaceae bacterium]
MNSPSSGFNGMALGHHLTAEFYDCASEILADAGKMENIFIGAAKASGATVLGSQFHGFEPQGVSGFVIIAESHFSVHAWPEHDYAAVDIFTCGENIDFDAALDYLKTALGSEAMVISGVMSRGIVGNNGVERLVPTHTGNTDAYALAWRTRFDSLDAWGLLDSIDVHDCDETLLHNPVALASALSGLCRELGLPGESAVHVEPFDDGTKGGGFNFCAILDGASQVSGNVSFAAKCVYVNIFSTGFFEPRQAAELALKAFRGRRYRMQVAVRR